MALFDTDIHFRLSGGANNVNPSASLGGVLSRWFPTSDVPQNIFRDVTNAERVAGITSYRCIYIYNDNPVDTMLATTVWLSKLPTSGGTTFAIGAEPAGVNANAPVIANETTAPSGVTFSSPTTFGTGINLGNIPALGRAGLWMRRTVTAGATALFIDNARLSVSAS